MNATGTDEITAYVEAVRAALAGLPETTRNELLEDLPEHLAEVAADGIGTLTERLGPPSVYAAELLASAGFVGGFPDPPPQRGPLRRAARDHPAPAAGRRCQGRTPVRVRPRERVPDPAPPRVVGAARLPGRDGDRLAAGRQRPADRPAAPDRRQRGRRPAAAGRVGARLDLARPPLAAPGAAGRGTRCGPARRCWCWWRWAASSAPTAAPAARSTRTSTTTHNPYGHVQDVFVYDEQGRLVEGARLFDQDGQPIRLGSPYC